MSEDTIFEQKLQIPSYLLDSKSQLAANQLLLMMQENAWAHVEKCGIGWNHLYQYNQFWALTRSHVKILRMPKWNEVIRLRTWGKFSEHLTHYRDHEILNNNGETLILATSTWVILDFTTGKPQKVENLPSHLYVNEYRNAILENAPKIRPVSFSPQKRQYKAVVFSDLDINQHVNNSKYLQFAIDAFDIEFVKKHQLKEFFINFLWQGKQGDEYAVQYQEIERNDFVTSIFSKEEERELARIKTIWE